MIKNPVRCLCENTESVLLAHAGVNIEESTCKQVETGDFLIFWQ